MDRDVVIVDIIGIIFMADVLKDIEPNSQRLAEIWFFRNKR